MEKINAFVGHSFIDEDKNVVEAFTSYFDSLKGALPFDWDHAEKAEPIALSEKVREKMEGKNLFIGIFTKKDCRVIPDKLKNVPIAKKKYASEADFSWGVSDWIIQESGYALAKDMKLLFLVEKDIGELAGLQGDLEYVPFNRENPTLSFDKIMQMIGKILPEKKISEPISKEKTMPPDDKEKSIEEEEEEHEDEQKLVDTPISKFRRSHRILSKLIITEKDFTKGEKELDKIIEDYKDDDTFDEIFWKSTCHRMMCKAGYSVGFSKLEKLAEDNPEETFPLSCLGGANKEYNRYSESALQYMKAAGREKKRLPQLEFIGNASESYALDGNFKEAYGVLLEEFHDSQLENSQYHSLYMNLANVAKKAKNDTLFTAFSEKALEYSPADDDIRFNLAYRYSEIENKPFALYHYKILCDHHEDAAHLNNIGVTYGNLGMKSKSVYSYKKAANEYRYTLAMSNLSNLYINQGMLDEAEDILNKAREEKNYHENVDHAMSRIQEVKTEDDETEEKILDNIDTERKFRTDFAEAYAVPFKVDIDGEWESEHGKIVLKPKDNRVTGLTPVTPPAKQTEEGKINSLQAMVSKAQSLEKKTLVLGGTIHNRAVEYALMISIKYPTTPNVLLSASESSKKYEGLMFIDKDSKIIEVMERAEDEKKWKFYKMERT
ncbi:MAG: tetratricopeptide repeat protein [Desulfobacteraceae bacterium]|nr:tetratricopeptide repeat protein [Desulfobacteraceae bacterium]